MGGFAFMTRRNDHDTSIAAAEKIKPITGPIKIAVWEFAMKRGNYGFTDSELTLAFPGKPESSYRKRRSELTREGRLVDSGQTRRNVYGNEMIVWRIK